MLLQVKDKKEIFNVTSCINALKYFTQANEEQLILILNERLEKNFKDIADFYMYVENYFINKDFDFRYISLEDFVDDFIELIPGERYFTTEIIYNDDDYSYILITEYIR